MKAGRFLGLTFASLVALGAAVTACSDDQRDPTGVGGAGTTGGNGVTSSSSASAQSASTANASSSDAASTTASQASSSTGTGGSGGSVRFVAFGDAGKGNQGQTDVANAIAAKCAADGCDFVQLLGDNIYDSGVDGTDDPQWQSKFEVPYANINLPFYVALGNHDYGGDGAGWEFDKGQHSVDYTAVSSKWEMPAKYFRRTQAHAEFFVLDTNMAMFDQADDQYADLPQWFAESTATWKIAFGHHPYLSNGPHGNAGEYEGIPGIPIVSGQGVKDLMDDVVCGNADVYICGHDHDMQWLQGQCNGTELIVSGAGAASTELEGDNPTHFESEALGFLYVRIEGDSFTGQFIGTDGSVLFERTITK